MKQENSQRENEQKKCSIVRDGDKYTAGYYDITGAVWVIRQEERQRLLTLIDKKISIVKELDNSNYKDLIVTNLEELKSSLQKETK